jgi:hypothetical protein
MVNYKFCYNAVGPDRRTGYYWLELVDCFPVDLFLSGVRCRFIFYAEKNVSFFFTGNNLYINNNPTLPSSLSNFIGDF